MIDMDNRWSLNAIRLIAVQLPLPSSDLQMLEVVMLISKLFMVIGIAAVIYVIIILVMDRFGFWVGGSMIDLVGE